MNLTEAAAFIGVSPKTLRLAVERGDITAEHPLSNGPWIFNRNSLNTDAVTELVARTRARRGHPEIPTAQQGSLDLWFVSKKCGWMEAREACQVHDRARFLWLGRFGSRTLFS